MRASHAPKWDPCEGSSFADFFQQFSTLPLLPSLSFSSLSKKTKKGQVSKVLFVLMFSRLLMMARVKLDNLSAGPYKVR